MEELPVVTISVLTYNSSKTVIETLESIKGQTYPKLKLQIADDFSTDNTVELCQSWIKQNNQRFVNTKIIVPPSNTGVSANCNRAWESCETTYHKEIAGDDILLSNCIEDNVKYVKSHPEAIVVFSRIRPFFDRFGVRLYKDDCVDYCFFELSPVEQHNYLIYKGNTLPAPAAFCNLDKLKALHIKNDTRIRNMEDYPKWIALSRMGIEFHFFNVYTVLYRQEESSQSVGLYSPSFFKQEVNLCLLYLLEEIKTKQDKEKIYNRISEYLTIHYQRAYSRARESKEYKVGHYFLGPLRKMKEYLLFFRYKKHM